MPIVWRSTMSKNQKWTKDCPKCGNTQSYSNKNNLKKASLLNRMCMSCRQLGKTYSLETKLKMSEASIGFKHSEDTKQAIREYHTGRKVSSETKLKMSKAQMGRVISDETRKKMSDSRTGYKHSNDCIKKLRLSAINRISEAKFNGGQVMPNYNPSSIPIIEEKARELGITDLQHAENGGEYHIKELGYFVDGYSKEKNIVIEYDEKHHKRHVKADQRRQKEITELLDCKFVRISK